MAQPGWGVPQNSNKALASLICGVLFLCAPASIASVVLGELGLADIKRSGERISGRGMAIAGVVLGWIGLAVLVIIVIAAIASPD